MKTKKELTNGWPGIVEHVDLEINNPIEKSKDVILLLRLIFYSVLVAMFIGSILPEEVTLRLNAVPLKGNLVHFFSFFVAACLINSAYPRIRARWAFMFLSGFGLLIEVVQYFLVYRECSEKNFLADVIGIMLFYVITNIVRKFYKVSSCDPLDSEPK